MKWSVIEQARQKLAKERGATRKDWGGRIPIALVYPNTYFVGMSSLGFQTIYRLFNEYDNLVAERFFVEGRGVSGAGRRYDFLDQVLPLTHADNVARIGS